MAITEELMKQYLDTLVDIRDYLEKSEEPFEKQVTIQERAKIDKPPKASEEEFAMEGGPAAPNAPAKGIAKEYIEVGTAGTTVGKKTQTPVEEGSTMLKAASKEKEDEEDPDDSEDSEESSSEDTEEIKSLLKDIREALSSNDAAIQSLKKSMPGMVDDTVSKHLDKTLRKMGFHPTRPDVVKLGIDMPSEVRKSEDRKDEVEGDLKKSDAEQESTLVKEIDKMSGKSWQELGQLREKAGLFRPFEN